MTDREETTARGYRHTPGNEVGAEGSTLAPGTGGGHVGGAGAAAGGDDASVIGSTVGGSPGGGDFDASEAYAGGVDADEVGGMGASGPGTGVAGSRIGDDQNASAGAAGADLGPLRREGDSQD